MSARSACTGRAPPPGGQINSKAPNTGQSFCGSHPTAKYLHHQRHSDPIIAGQVLHANRALRAGLDPKFRSAPLRRLLPRETLNRSRFPKLHSGPSNPAVTPISERRQKLTDTSGGGNGINQTRTAPGRRVRTPHTLAQPTDRAPALDSIKDVLAEPDSLRRSSCKSCRLQQKTS
jgi:hypothetical protein